MWRGCHDLASRPASPQHLLPSLLSPNWLPLPLLLQSMAAPVRSPVQAHGGAESFFSPIFSEVSLWLVPGFPSHIVFTCLQCLGFPPGPVLPLPQLLRSLMSQAPQAPLVQETSLLLQKVNG